MFENESPARRYFLVCTNPLQDFWWCRLFRPGYRHCYVLIWDGVVWLYVDPSHSRTHVSILDLYVDTHPGDWIEDEHATVIEAAVRTEGRSRAPWVVGPVTCVESVKALLGIRSFWIWTPWQLAKHIRRS